MAIRPSITPCLVYADAQAAIDFLGAAFGFQPQLVVPDGETGGIAHAQLVLADGCMIMLSTARPDSRTRFSMVAPADTGGLVTACICVALDDPDAHHAQAVAAGAVIIAAPHDNPYGGRGYEAKDLEGNVWSFASYDPWAAA